MLFRSRRGRCDDDIGLEAQAFAGKGGEPVELAICGKVVDCDGAPLHVAQVAQALGVGIEIDYENSSSANLAGLQQFVNAYRSVLPYDATGNNHAARLTIDLGAGDRCLTDITRYATQNWLTTTNPVLDYANAMVGGTSSGTPADWQEHVDGKPTYSPPVPPLAAAKFTGGLYLKGNIANCNNFDSSEQKADANFVQTVAPNGAGEVNPERRHEPLERQKETPVDEEIEEPQHDCPPHQVNLEAETKIGYKLWRSE